MISISKKRTEGSSSLKIFYEIYIIILVIYYLLEGKVNGEDES
jgi:hypothetical protein